MSTRSTILFIAAVACLAVTPAAAQVRTYLPPPSPYQPIPVPAPPRDLGQSFRDAIRSTEPPPQGSLVCYPVAGGGLDCRVR